MIKNHFLKMIIFIISAIFTALISIYIQQHYKPSEDKYVIKYATFIQEDMLSIPPLIFKRNQRDLKLTFRGKPINELSRETYVITNQSEKHLDKVRLFIDFKDKENLPIMFLYAGSDRYPQESFRQISVEGGLYEFELDYLNIFKNMDDALVLDFYFANPNVQDGHLWVGNKGMMIQEEDFRAGPIEFIQINLIKILILLSLACFVVFIFRYEHIQEKIKLNYIEEKINEILKKKISISEKANEIIDIVKNWSPKKNEVLDRFFRTKSD